MVLLSDIGLRGVEGLQLIELDVTPQDRRERFLRLSRDGPGADG
jgi:hypothetical protein